MEQMILEVAEYIGRVISKASPASRKTGKNKNYFSTEHLVHIVDYNKKDIYL